VVQSLGVLGFYWSSSPNLGNSVQAYNLIVGTALANPANSNDRAYGFSVRCIKN
jgi:hypothetical protein